jgi:predicted nucleic acid-binding protein
MTGDSVALDTNIAIELLHDVVAVVQWLAAFSELSLPVTVLGELRYGALNSVRPAESIDAVERLRKHWWK